ncbi:MAG: hypothetical protein WCF82_08835 [Microcoleus sp.]
MSDDILGSKDAVVISAESMNSDDIRATIQSNIDFVNALFEELLNREHLSYAISRNTQRKSMRE